MFDRIFRIFIAILPWSVLGTVFLGSKLGIPWILYIKEIILLVLGFLLAWDFHKRKTWPKLDILDGLILGYIGYMIFISIVNHESFAAFKYGGRYDFEFLLAFFLIRHAGNVLTGSIAHYVRIFLISASSALIAGILVRFVFHETILLYFGFSPNLSNWSFGGTPPIYHGIDGANVKRFQGIFDGPNPAAYFILVYIGLLVHFFRTKKIYHYLVSLWIIVLVGLIFLTYSRSSLIGLAVGCLSLVILSLGTICKKYRKESLYVLLFGIVFTGIFYIRYESTISQIILRSGSSQGHFDRAITGLKRFTDHPMGQGLGTAGPAYRYVQNIADAPIYGGDLKKTEDFYIPESWYIQQLVEGGVMGFVLFVAIMGMILWYIFPIAPMVFASFVAILTMNLFLHSFESVYISLILFLFLGLFLSKRKMKT